MPAALAELVNVMQCGSVEQVADPGRLRTTSVGRDVAEVARKRLEILRIIMGVEIKQRNVVALGKQRKEMLYPNIIPVVGGLTTGQHQEYALRTP
jgi:hypothetical protein